jgi:hypothetical protein
MISKINFAFAVVNAAGDATYNYETNGADWPDFSPDCGNSNQSPINLISYSDDKDKDFPYKVYKSKDDEI